MRAAIYLAVVLVATPVAAGTEPRIPPGPIKITAAQAAWLSAYTPKPEYPGVARRRSVTGSGIFRLHVVRASGTVASVDIERSTQHAILDSAAVEALRRWRLKPDVLRTITDPRDPSRIIIIRVPITFTMGEGLTGRTPFFWR